MKKELVKFSLLIVGMAFIFSSCLDNDYTPPDYDAILAGNLAGVDQTQLALDGEIIADSLGRWGVNNVEIDLEGVRYVIHTLGTGTKPLLTSIITVNYTAKLLAGGPDGEPFDEGENLQINLYNLIMGWQTTLPHLPEGTIATLYIPSGLAYGNDDVKNNQGDIIIPKNSNLIFEIELVGVYN